MELNGFLWEFPPLDLIGAAARCLSTENRQLLCAPGWHTTTCALYHRFYPRAS
jgi:hypothetical protein